MKKISPRRRELVPELDARHVGVGRAGEIPQVFPLGLLFLLGGQARLDLEGQHSHGAVLQVLPALSVDPLDLDAEGVEVVGGDFGEHLAPEHLAAPLEDLLGDLEVLVVHALLRVNVAPNQVGIVPEEGDHGST